jgi:uridylate kinase
MSHTPRYKRVLVKLSGESLCGAGGFGMDAASLASIAGEIAPVAKAGVQVAVVIGGGNFIRGRDIADNPYVQRSTADAMGMLATTINALALHDALESMGVAARTMGTVTTSAVCEPFHLREAVRHLEKGIVVLFAGGTGSPFFSTDTCAALRACEIRAEVILKATKVDGVYDSDPVKNPAAKKYDRLSYSRALADRLGVMDLSAISMCMENRIPIIVFQMSGKGNLARVVSGETLGTLVTE